MQIFACFFSSFRASAVALYAAAATQLFTCFSWYCRPRTLTNSFPHPRGHAILTRSRCPVVWYNRPPGVVNTLSQPGSVHTNGGPILALFKGVSSFTFTGTGSLGCCCCMWCVCSLRLANLNPQPATGHCISGTSPDGGRLPRRDLFAVPSWPAPTACLPATTGLWPCFRWYCRPPLLV